MDKRVERQHIDKWLDENYPNAVTKLSMACGITANTIAKIRLGRVPKNQDARRRLSEAIGIHVDALFPPVTAGEGEAS